jgi:prepilin-type processing-associated H-X9-DG protein
MRIAPFIEIDNLYKTADLKAWPWWQTLPSGETVMSVECKLFKCPSDIRAGLKYVDPGNPNNVAALTSYLGVTGKNQFREAGGQDGILYVNSSVKITSITDGTSNTLLVGERPPSNNLVYGWQWAGAGDLPHFGTSDVVLGVRERYLTPGADPDFFRPGEINDPDDKHRYHYWSLHPGGGNWLFADGSVRFITYSAGTAYIPGSTTVTILEALASRSGGETVPLP